MKKLVEKYGIPSLLFTGGLGMLAVPNYPVGLGLMFVALVWWTGLVLWRWGLFVFTIGTLAVAIFLGFVHYDLSTSPASDSITFYERNRDPMGATIWKGDETILNLNKLKTLTAKSHNWLYFRPGVGNIANGVTLKNAILILRWKADLDIKLRDQRPEWDGPTRTTDGYIEYAALLPDINHHRIELSPGWLELDSAPQSFELTYRIVGKDNCQREIRHGDLTIPVQ